MADQGTAKGAKFSAARTDDGQAGTILIELCRKDIIKYIHIVPGRIAQQLPRLF
jgi:hypothetical protein